MLCITWPPHHHQQTMVQLPQHKQAWPAWQPKEVFKQRAFPVCSKLRLALKFRCQKNSWIPHSKSHALDLISVPSWRGTSNLIVPNLIMWYYVDTHTPSLSSLTPLRPQWFHYGLRYVEVLIMTNTSENSKLELHLSSLSVDPRNHTLHPRVPWKSSTGCHKGCRNTKLEPKVAAAKIWCMFMAGNAFKNRTYHPGWWHSLPLLVTMYAHTKHDETGKKRLGVDGKNPAANDTAINSLQWFLRRFNHPNRLAKWFVQTWHPKKVPRSSMLKFDSSTFLGKKATCRQLLWFCI